MTLIRHWIDGKPHDATPARTGPVYNPATGEALAEVAFAAPEDVDRAVTAARSAFETWRRVSLSKRTEILFRFRNLIDREQDAIVRTIVREHGKVWSDAAGELRRGQEIVEYACGIPELLKGSFSENVSTDVDSYSLRQPIGVVAGITPFNFPAMVPMWMFPIAIACGNAFVLKPSEKDPSTAMLLAELWSEAGLPDGVFNVVHGDRVAVEAILEHPDVTAVSFVGSTPVARHIYETGTHNGKRVQALGGAKNHMIVLPDADPRMAAEAAVGAAYGSAGERCMAISVVAAVGAAGDQLVEESSALLKNIKVGDGMDPDSDMGPLITREHRDRVASYIERGVTEGAMLVADGRELAARSSGFFLGPTLFDRVTPEMSVYRDEIFGPVLSTVRCDTYEEAVTLVNRNPYANGVALFTNDGGAARHFQSAVEVGMVGINVPIPVPMAYHSFGGWRHSLFGDVHMHGPDGVRFYTRGKVVTARWPDPTQRGVDLGFPTNR